MSEEKKTKVEDAVQEETVEVTAEETSSQEAATEETTEEVVAEETTAEEEKVEQVAAEVTEEPVAEEAPEAFDWDSFAEGGLATYSKDQYKEFVKTRSNRTHQVMVPREVPELLLSD